ncbi:hypothetical protein HU200_035185 [Digitaria exilis]|uniref:F-box domain-containing protein n=1 Tax=Digitaria exilis TaxID=1010633 RepID=A0A835EPR8_9POAL|nr:hypothetical protein HU200_035185 [Digitaria exilis]
MPPHYTSKTRDFDPVQTQHGTEALGPGRHGPYVGPGLGCLLGPASGKFGPMAQVARHDGLSCLVGLGHIGPGQVGLVPGCAGRPIWPSILLGPAIMSCPRARANSMAGGNPDWSSLPGELLDLISGHLASERDLLHFRQVCTSWRASVTSRLAAPIRPWVLASRTDPSQLGSIGEYSIWRGALGDCKWSPTRLVLWDPSVGVEVALPPADGISEVFLSGDPLASPPPPSGWMAVAAQITESLDNKILFWRPGDAAWTPAARKVPYSFDRAQSIAFHGGKMYCIESSYKIAIYDLSRADHAPSPPIFLPQQLNYVPAAHLVSCNGKLLLVVLFSFDHDNVVVYKLGPAELDMGREEMDLGESERVTDLGGYSLFLGRSDGYALSAEEHPAIRGNCIYYVQVPFHFREKQDWAFVFDLKSQKVVEEIPFPREHRENRETVWWPCSWFCPRKPILLKRH